MLNYGSFGDGNPQKLPTITLETMKEKIQQRYLEKHFWYYYFINYIKHNNFITTTLLTYLDTNF